MEPEAKQLVSRPFRTVRCWLTSATAYLLDGWSVRGEAPTLSGRGAGSAGGTACRATIFPARSNRAGALAQNCLPVQRFLRRLPRVRSTHRVRQLVLPHGIPHGGHHRKTGPLENAALWQELLAASQRHEMDWRWVRGHAGDPGNERADELANMGVAHARAEMLIKRRP